MRQCRDCGETFDDGQDRCPADGAPLIEPDLRLGTVLDGKYLTEARIGSGALYKASQIVLARSVAVATLAEASPRALERFKRAALLVARLHHPNIITVIDFGVANDFGAYIVVEYLKGHSLAAEIERRGRLGVEECVALLRTACAAVQAMHEAGVVHGGLSPAKLFLEREAEGVRLKILDFAHARLASEGGDPRSDVFALGRILYEALTGRQAADAPAGPEPPSRAVPGVPERVDAVALRAVAADPDDRFRTAAELAAALAGLVPHPPERESGVARPAVRRSGGRQTAGKLPRPVTAFVGREEGVADVLRCIADARLVTLVGLGGIGKTRLAVEVARSAAAGFRDGAWLVEMAGVVDASLVPSAVARVLGVPEQGTTPIAETLLAALEPREILLVLDNCEHLRDACARLAGDLLERCPSLRILATSREPLGFDRETIWRVPGFAVPDAARDGDPEGLGANESARLFVDRARLAKPGFILGPRNARTVAALCRALEGIPLAIELAAARVRVMPVEQLLARMDDRFRLLTGASRTTADRQRTLRATLDWSYELLTGDEKALLRRLAVFAGGLSHEAAERVCCAPGAGEHAEHAIDELAVRDLLARLVDKSLLVRDEGPRYRLLETVRQYVREKLREAGEEQRCLAAHRAWVTETARRTIPESGSLRTVDLYATLDVENDNIRAALRWSTEVDRDPEASQQLAGVLAHFWNTRGQLQEGRRWIEAALSLEGDVAMATRATALQGLALLAVLQGAAADAIAAADEAIALWSASGDRAGVAAALNVKSCALDDLDDFEGAYAVQEECLALSRELGLPRLVDQAVFSLGMLSLWHGDLVRAKELLEEALAGARAEGNRYLQAVMLHNLGEIGWLEGDCAGAMRCFDESLPISEEFGAQRLVADNLKGLARSLAGLGEGDRAREALDRAATLCRDMGDERALVGLLATAASVRSRRGEPEMAVSLLGAFDAIGAMHGVSFEPVMRVRMDGLRDELRDEIGPERYERATARGRSLTLDEALALATEDSPAAPDRRPRTP
jgi:predicted ATPase